MTDIVTRYWWVSVVDHRRPEGHRFLGACIVPGQDFDDAAREAARMHGFDPYATHDHQAAGLPCPSHVLTKILAKRPDAIGRIMSRAECEQFDKDMKSSALRRR